MSIYSKIAVFSAVMLFVGTTLYYGMFFKPTKYKIVKVLESGHDDYFIIKYKIFVFFWAKCYHPMWDTQVLKFKTYEQAMEQVSAWLDYRNEEIDV